MSRITTNSFGFFKRKENFKQIVLDYQAFIYLIALLTGFVLWVNLAFHPLYESMGKGNAVVQEMQEFQQRVALQESQRKVIIHPKNKQQQAGSKKLEEIQEASLVADDSRKETGKDDMDFLLDGSFCFCNCQELDQLSTVSDGYKEQIVLNVDGPSNLLNTIFDRVYVINYEVIRRDYIKSIMRFLGIRTTIIDAVPPPDKRVSKYQEALRKWSLLSSIFNTEQQQITDEQVAQRLSHLRVWQDMINNKIESALILEDNVDFTYNLGMVVYNISRYLPQSADIVWYGHCQSTVPYHSESFVKADEPKCMHAYGIHDASILKKLIKEVDRHKNQDFGAVVFKAVQANGFEGYIIDPAPVYYIQQQFLERNEYAKQTVRKRIAKVLEESVIPDCYIELFRQ